MRLAFFVTASLLLTPGQSQPTISEQLGTFNAPPSASPSTACTCTGGKSCCGSWNGYNLCYDSTTEVCSADNVRARTVCPIGYEVCVFEDPIDELGSWTTFGTCYDPTYQKCCPNTVTTASYMKCCNDTQYNSHTQKCISVEKLYSVVGKGYVISRSIDQPTSSFYEGRTTGRLIVGAAVPLLFAIGVLLTLVYSLFLFFKVDDSGALNVLTVVWAVLTVLCSVFLIFSPLWHFGILCAFGAGVSLALGRHAHSTALIIAFLVNFLILFLFVNASFAIHESGAGPIEALRTYIGGSYQAPPDPSYSSMGDYESTCGAWFLGFYTRSIWADYRTPGAINPSPNYSPRDTRIYNPYRAEWGLCHHRWLQTLIIFSCVFIVTQVQLVITLAARLHRSKSDHIVQTKVTTMN